MLLNGNSPNTFVCRFITATDFWPGAALLEPGGNSFGTDGAEADGHAFSLPCRTRGDPVEPPAGLGAPPTMINEEGRTTRPPPSPHGRTRMTVFPPIRLVGLKAAPESSRIATVPLFVLSRPSRTR